MVSEEIDKVSALIDIEKNHALNLLKSVEKLRNVVVRETLKGIAHDSNKHAGFFHAILSLIRDKDPAIAGEDYDRLEKIIERHIKVEELMMEESKKLLSSLEDLRIRHLLKEIYDDEVMHHALMKRILDAVISRETIFEVGGVRS
jgi:rubrerythrin